MSTDYTPAENRYENVVYRRSGRSGLTLPPVSLGLWQSLGAGEAEPRTRRILYHAFDHGVTHFDLANNYGTPGGNSERIAGRILRDMPRDELIVSTKAGYGMWPGPYGNFGGKKYLVASLDQSLLRLGLDYVDIFYHHRPDPDTPLEETFAALDLIVRQGKALYVGISNYNGEQTRAAADVIAQHDWTPVTIHQPFYNLLGRHTRDDLLPVADELGIGVIPYCPLAQGFLTDRYLDGVPEDSRFAGKKRQRYDKAVENGTIDKARRLRNIARQRGQSLAQMSLAWLLHDPRITSALIGVSKVEQLAENLQAADNTDFTDDELAAIEEIVAED